MPGETDLQTLLKSMRPELQPGDYVFCTMPDTNPVLLKDALMCFREQEGLTLVLQKEQADALQLSYSFVTAWITLTVHSSLEAVGLTAAFATALAEENISCNVVAAYYHDHIFVAKPDAARAIAVLEKRSIP
jgi:uncharacterized protein